MQVAGTGDEHTNSPPTEHLGNQQSSNRTSWEHLGNLLNAVLIRRDNKDGVLHTTKLESKI